MVTATQVGIRFTDDDFALVIAIMKKTGIGNRTDVVRLAIRRLAVAEGINPDDVITPTRKARPAKATK